MTNSFDRKANRYTPKILLKQKIQIKTLKGDLFQIEVEGTDQVQ